jgi:hypothetical protein
MAESDTATWLGGEQPDIVTVDVSREFAEAVSRVLSVDPSKPILLMCEGKKVAVLHTAPNFELLNAKATLAGDPDRLFEMVNYGRRESDEGTAMYSLDLEEAFL